MGLLRALLVAAAPRPLRRHAGRWLCGWDIHPTAHLGRSIIRVPKVTLGPGASIGPRNTIRGLQELVLEEGAVIDSRNQIIGFPPAWDHFFPEARNRNPSLILRAHAMITTAHEIDCSDRVELAEYAVIAGFGSQVLTHSLNLVTDRQTTGPVEIGAHAAVMTGCILLSGTRVPARSIVSAGSVVTTKLTKELTFYRGNPAEAVRDLPATLRYFRRGEQAAPAAE